MRRALVVLALLLCSIAPAQAQFSISIGVDLPYYPQLVRVPGYPVYYAPQLNSNYFFYDGLYWVFANDTWYASTWYNGPWEAVAPDYVPLYVLRVPVRYYRRPPVYFRGWGYNAPPRWGDHWGREWHDNHRGWDSWNRRSVPAAAPLPTYQRRYAGDRYPHREQQSDLQVRNYRYQPRDAAAQRQYHAQMPASTRTNAAPPADNGRRPRNESNGRGHDAHANDPNARAPAPQPAYNGERRGGSQGSRPAPQSGDSARPPANAQRSAPRPPAAPPANAAPRAPSPQPQSSARPEHAPQGRGPAPQQSHGGGPPPAQPQTEGQRGHGRGPAAPPNQS